MSDTLPGNSHAAEAQLFAEALHGWMESEGETDATMIAVALDRQTEAALALAFELRTANLIAWTTANGSEPDKATAEMIKARLGLTEGPTNE